MKERKKEKNRKKERKKNRKKERKKKKQKERKNEKKKERNKERKKERQKEKKQNRKRKDFNHLSVHQWLRSAIPDSQQPTSPIGFLFLKLPPPPCAVLLVFFGKIGHDLWPFYSGHCGRPIWEEKEEETGVFNSRLYSVTETGVFCDLKPKETTIIVKGPLRMWYPNTSVQYLKTSITSRTLHDFTMFYPHFSGYIEPSFLDNVLQEPAFRSGLSSDAPSLAHWCRVGGEVFRAKSKDWPALQTWCF